MGGDHHIFKLLELFAVIVSTIFVHHHNHLFHQVIVRLETEKYDLEERQKRQDYDVSTIFYSLYSRLQLEYHHLYSRF